MNNIERVRLFATELNFIKDGEIRNFTINMLSALPEYFFTIPASSTGKYHPNYALGEGGLVRHVKAAVRIAKELFTILPYESEQQDIIISALLLHDGCKNGKNGVIGGYTLFRHPLEMVDLINDTCPESKPYITEICNLIASHMGQWNKDFKSSAELPLPKTKTQNFVHMCDYLASRKQLEYNFDIPVTVR